MPPLHSSALTLELILAFFGFPMMACQSFACVQLRFSRNCFLCKVTCSGISTEATSLFNGSLTPNFFIVICYLLIVISFASTFPSLLFVIRFSRFFSRFPRVSPFFSPSLPSLGQLFYYIISSHPCQGVFSKKIKKFYLIL